MKTLTIAIALALAAAAPAAAQSNSEPSSDRYTREPQPRQDDQQAQTPQSRHPGEVEKLRGSHMDSPNVTGEGVKEDPATGVPVPQQQQQQRTGTEDQGSLR